MKDLKPQLIEIGKRAKNAALHLRMASTDEKNDVLGELADLVDSNIEKISLLKEKGVKVFGGCWKREKRGLKRSHVGPFIVE